MPIIAISLFNENGGAFKPPEEFDEDWRPWRPCIFQSLKAGLGPLGKVLGGPFWRLLGRPPCSARNRLVLGYNIAGEVRYGRPPMSVCGGVSTLCELACTGQGGEALPSPLRDPLFLTCARAVSPRPAFGVCRFIAATPHVV